MSASLGPRSIERPADRGHTFVHSLDSETPAKVDAAGGIQLHDQPWSIDWWIGAEDRWYFPSREPAIRQRRIGGGPVLESAVRVLSGDVMARVYAVNAGESETIVLEIENDSPLPVAFVLAIRPYDLDGKSSPVQVDLDTDEISINGVPMVRLPRRPNEFSVESEDVFDVISRGGSLPAVSGDGRVSGSGTAAAVYPIPHKTKLRFVISEGGTVTPHSVPAHDVVASGWDTIIEQGGRFVLPDNGLTQQVEASRARLLGSAATLPDRIAALEPGAGRVLEGLALSGAVNEVFGSLGAFAGTFPTSIPGTLEDAAAVISAIGRAARLADDAATANELLEPSVQLTRLIEKGSKKAKTMGPRNEAFSGLARLLFTVGQVDAARDLMERGGQIARADIVTDLAGLSALAEEASPARSWGDDDDVKAAQFWIGARQMVLEGRLDSLDLLPSFPAAWRGGNLEIHGAPTGHGVISFGIRWHGYRPALLWELNTERMPGRTSTLRCPGLDPEWQTTDARGDALLAGAPEPLPDTPMPGDSFQ